MLDPAFVRRIKLSCHRKQHAFFSFEWSNELIYTKWKYCFWFVCCI